VQPVNVTDGYVVDLCSAEDMTSSNAQDGMQAAGINSILPKEHGSKFFTLPVVKNSDKDV